MEVKLVSFSVLWDTALKQSSVFPRVISGGGYYFFSHKKGAFIRGRRLFQILLTGSHALNILCYYSIKSKNDHLK